mgnify:CR=1 FL=1
MKFLVTILTLAATATSTPVFANHGHSGGGNNNVGPAIVAGAVVGAIAGTIAANRSRYPRRPHRPPVYHPPVYNPHPPVYHPHPPVYPQPPVRWGVKCLATNSQFGGIFTGVSSRGQAYAAQYAMDACVRLTGAYNYNACYVYNCQNVRLR